MAILFDDASTEYLVHGAALKTDEPCTLACWFYTDVAQNQGLIGYFNSGSTNGSMRLMSRGDNRVRATVQTSSGSATEAADTSTFHSLNTWHHACGVFNSDSSRSAFLDGGGKVTNSNTAAVSGLDETDIGRRNNNGGSQYFSGRIAHAAVWSVALSDAEVALLASGVSPLMVRPESLTHYLPMYTVSALTDIMAGAVFTPVNTPATAESLHLFNGGAQIINFSEAVAGGITGSGTPTEGADTSSASGQIGHQGSGSPTEGADTSAATGQIGHQGSGAPTEGADTSTGTGTVSSAGSITGSGSPTEGADTAAGTGQVGHQGTAAATEGADTATGTGQIGHQGSAAVTEGADTSSGTGAVNTTITGSAAITEGADTASGTGTVFNPNAVADRFGGAPAQSLYERARIEVTDEEREQYERELAAENTKKYQPEKPAKSRAKPAKGTPATGKSQGLPADNAPEISTLTTLGAVTGPAKEAATRGSGDAPAIPPAQARAAAANDTHATDEALLLLIAVN